MKKQKGLAAVWFLNCENFKLKNWIWLYYVGLTHYFSLEIINKLLCDKTTYTLGLSCFRNKMHTLQRAFYGATIEEIDSTILNDQLVLIKMIYF